MKAPEKKPLAIDLFCGLGGWTEGLLAAGWDVVGYDIEKHEYGKAKYPAKLVVRDVLTIHGSEFKDAELIVASPPCQEYSYMAMPWTRGKQISDALNGHGWFPEGYKGSRNKTQLNRLFNACFRIQREAIEAAGKFIPLVIENVRGAQRWIGPAWDHYGSFYLWGDVPALMPVVRTHAKVPGFRFDGSGGSFQTASVEKSGVKAGGNWSGYGTPGYVAKSLHQLAAQKTYKDSLGGYGGDFGWDDTPKRRGNSKSAARKAASAQIAKIPFTLAKHVAEYWHPNNRKKNG